MAAFDSLVKTEGSAKRIVLLGGDNDTITYGRGRQQQKSSKEDFGGVDYSCVSSFCGKGRRVVGRKEERKENGSGREIICVPEMTNSTCFDR